MSQRLLSWPVRRVLQRVDEPSTIADETPMPEASAASPSCVDPDDRHNRALVAEVHPEGWQNPEPRGRYNLVVIGGGTAGLVSAAGAAGLQARVALIERRFLGGDCLNTGCVPSKALIAAGRMAHAARSGSGFGVHAGDVQVDFSRVMERMRRERAAIAPHDGAARFRGLGVDVFFGGARFSGRDRVLVGDAELSFARAVVATGARPAVPSIDGLAEAGYLTSESLFGLVDLPRRLTVIGGGPIGCEMAQCFARFGSEVTVVELADEILGADEPEAASVVREALSREGVRFRLGAEVRRVDPDRTCVLAAAEGEERIEADAILVAAGRVANVEDLDLDAAGVMIDGGVAVDDRLRTANKRIYAAGDCASRFRFTHAADAMARIVLRNALFFGRQKLSALDIPRVTYTDPELACVGLTPSTAAQRGIELDTFEVPMADIDRARLDGTAAGFLRVHVVRGKGAIAGATMVSAHAGEIISQISLAMQAAAGLGTLTSVIVPYPTESEALVRVADQWSRSRLTPRVERLFAWLMRRRR